MFSTFEPFKKQALALAMSTTLVACGGDDNDGEIRDLQSQNAELQRQINDLSSVTIEELKAQIVALEAEGNSEKVRELQDQLAKLDPTYVDNLNLTQVHMAYSHNSYDSLDSNDTSKVRWPTTNIAAQLDAGIRVLEFDIWSEEGAVAHDESTVNQHCATVTACLEAVNAWSDANPNHSPLVLQFEMHDNGTFVEEGEQADQQIADRTAKVVAKMKHLAEAVATVSDKVIRYQDSLDNVGSLRGKFLITTYRKYNTPFFSDRKDGFSKRQTMPIATALGLAAATDEAQANRKMLVDAGIFLSSRYVATDSPDGWAFADADYEGQLAIEKEAGLEGKMLRVLKQDGYDYTSESFTDNTLMISTIKKGRDGNMNAARMSKANAMGANSLAVMEEDAVTAMLLTDDGILPHCTRSGRDLSYCAPSVKKLANQHMPEKTLRIAIIPDSQGRDDDKMKNKVTLPDGSTTHSGLDGSLYGEADGFFDGNGIKINVKNPHKPFAVSLSQGDDTPATSMDDLVEVDFDDRKDTPYDWRHLPRLNTDPMVAKILAENVDMAIAVGDMTDLRTELEYAEWKAWVADPLKAEGIDMLAVRGNHEIVDGRDWELWFSDQFENEKKSLDNYNNGVSPYEGHVVGHYDQGHKLYTEYVGKYLPEGTVGYPGVSDLVYSYKRDNVLFVAVDVYASELVNTSYRGTWSTFFPFIKAQIEENKESVDHIVVISHEAFATKKRPHQYDYDEYAGYLAGDDEVTPGVMGWDVSQLGHLEQQSETHSGLGEEVLAYFAENNITYLAGHDHQYSRSAVHSVKGDKNSDFFMQMVVGNTSWKAYNNRYGENPYYESLIAQANNVNADKDKANGISFVILEIAGSEISMTNYYTEHGGLSEDDMTRGAKWVSAEDATDPSKGSWVVPQSDGTETTIETQWTVGDTARYTNDAFQRIVGPVENYWSTTRTPMDEGYVGTEASILEGYNVTFNSYEAFGANARSKEIQGRDNKHIDNGNKFSAARDSHEDGTGEFLTTEVRTTSDDREIEINAHVERHVDHASELLSLSWKAKTDATVSDILSIDGTNVQDGTYFNTIGYPMTKAKEDGSESGIHSRSEHFYDKDGILATNRTQVVRDGIIDEQDHADVMAIAITAPAGTQLEELTLARFQNNQWEPVVDEQCFTNTSYSDDFSVMYNDGTGSVGENWDGTDKNKPASEGGCKLMVWGYNAKTHSVWGMVHKDGDYAVIKK